LQGPLGAAFAAAVELIREAKGRVIVTGLGKSGHIARKIAATLASTGTPAFFVHAAEAGHGDLGMITPDDVILALSWSGEQPEFKNLVNYSARFAIPMIAVTANAGSSLGAAARIVLELPKAREACPHNLAPTTSTLMQAAIGDALAIALLESRGFTALQFANFHPGGKLGAMLKHTSDLMHSGEALPVKPLGTKMADALVDDIMTRNPRTIGRDSLASEAVELLNSAKITMLVVTDGNKPVGILHLHDLLRAGVA